MNIQVTLRETSELADVPASSKHVIVTPGEVVCPSAGYIRGHGTFIKDGNLVASVAGIVERVNKLITVRPLKSRWLGEVGDIVVGRVVDLGPTRWVVDVGGLQHSNLHLSAVTLPNAQQRKRTAEDQLQMREIFSEQDLLSAEVHELHRDGSVRKMCAESIASV
jgi:exosome complex component RRP4